MGKAMKSLIKCLVVVLSFLIIVFTDAYAASIEDQIRTDHSNALKIAGVKNFTNQCDDCVYYKLRAMGIFSTSEPYATYNTNGNNCYNVYSRITKTSTGYSATKYAGKNALDTLSSSGSKEVYNIVVSYHHQYNYTDANPGAGHVLLIHAIKDGYVYLSESYAYGGVSQGQPLKIKYSTFKSNWNEMYGYTMGAVVFSKDGNKYAKVSNMKATNLSGTGGTIECDVNESDIKEVKATIWSEEKGYDSWIWLDKPASVSGNHYTFNFSTSSFDNNIGEYRAYFHVFFTDGTSKRSENRLDFNVPKSAAPVGIIDVVESKGQGEVTVAGWAYDADNTTMSIPVHVYVNGPCESAAEGFVLTADKSRPDVNKAKGITGNHGYNDTICLKTQTTGKVSLYFYAINDDGTNAFTFLGSREVTLSNHKHNYVLEKDTLPTCTTNGKQIQKCSCGSTIETVIKALGHNEVVDKAIEPTETANGMTEGKHCTVCGEITQKPEILPMKGQDSIEKTDESITGKLGNHEYVVCNGSFSALEAASKQTSGYHLATITSLDEHNFIMGLIDQLDVKSTGYWLGASDEEEEGVFKWYTGEVFSYNRWPVGQPDNKDADDGGPENYLGIWSFGVWNDWAEKTKLGYVLEKDEYSECEHKWN